MGAGAGTVLQGLVLCEVFAVAASGAEKSERPINEKGEAVNQGGKRAPPLLYKTVHVPAEFLAQGKDGSFGGDLRVGDLTGNGQVDFLVYRAVDNFCDGGGMKPCFMGAFTLDGKALWKAGEGGLQPGRPGPVAVHDIDGDGKAEVICFFRDPAVKCHPTSMKNVVVQIRNGATGAVKTEAAPQELRRCRGRGDNWAHQRILVANLRGNAGPRDFVIKLGENLLAFDNELNVLWTYKCKWKSYSRCPAYIPSVGDIDGDGRDEINGGYFLIDHDGTVLWEKKLGRHMDSVAIAEWDDGRVRAFCSGFGHVMDEKGNAVLKLGEEIVPHGQELRVGRFDDSVPGPQMMIRYNGHTPEIMLVSVAGKIIRRFKLNDSPNNTGMEAVYWNGPDKPALLYNGGRLWRGNGKAFAVLPDLGNPMGNPRQGWYHCIPADVCGDAREEVVVYNPWDSVVRIYTPAPVEPEKFAGYRPGPRQYNVRLMD